MPLARGTSRTWSSASQRPRSRAREVNAATRHVAGLTCRLHRHGRSWGDREIACLGAIGGSVLAADHIHEERGGRRVAPEHVVLPAVVGNVVGVKVAGPG